MQIKIKPWNSGDILEQKCIIQSGLHMEQIKHVRGGGGMSNNKNPKKLNI